jgi:spore maturation protein CgeB
MSKLLIVGNPELFHVGAHLRNAANSLDIPSELVDVNLADAGPRWKRRFNWWLRGRRPNRLSAFSHELVETCRRLRPHILLTTGLAPASASALQAIGGLGVKRLNFLTDDPWNPAHSAPWFMKALPTYDHVFSPRRANMDDLTRLGCANVHYLPFAYAPELHFPEAPAAGDNNSLRAMWFLLEAPIPIDSPVWQR